MLYLSIPQHRRDRATHEKARSLRPGELRWIRVYVDDLDDLAGEPITVRFLDHAILLLASKRDWQIPNDARRIANRLDLRTTDTTKAIKRLLNLHRLELVEVADKLSTPGNVQIGLDLSRDSQPSQARVTAESASSQRRVSVESATSALTPPPHVTADVSALIDASLSSRDPTGLTDVTQARGTRQEQEQRRREKASSNGNVTSYDAAAIAQDRHIVNRLIGLACRGNPKSADVIRYECVGLPDSAIARTIESYLGRTPRPSGAGYVVATLRALRTELGLTDPRARIQREPRLSP